MKIFQATHSFQHLQQFFLKKCNNLTNNTIETFLNKNLRYFLGDTTDIFY